MKTPNGQRLEAMRLEAMMLCPITNEVMTDPVIDHEGNSYQRIAILDWLERQHTSPITRNPLRPEQLTTNRALRDLLEVHEDQRSVAEAGRRLRALSCNGGAGAGGPKFDICLESSYDCNEGLGLVQVTVSDDESLDHKTSEVVCVIDVSFSMDSPAKMHGDSEGSAGLSLLDIVKHATATIIETLDENDKLAIVAYASSARVVLPFTKMTKNGRSKASNAAKSLKTCGNTNIWDGLSKAMDLVQKEGVTHNANILLLTDGLPNVHPPRGELQTLIRYKETHLDLRCRISTFGFGYNLDSKLLSDMAVEGGGYYGFIPDSSFVGTVFINATSNILSTAIPNCDLLLEATPGITIQQCLSLNKGATLTSWGMSIVLPGGLRFGQTFDVLVKLQDERCTKDVLPFYSTFQFHTHDGHIQETGGAADPMRTEDDDIQIAAALQRSKVVDLILTNSIESKMSKPALNLATKNVKKLLEEMQRSGIPTKHNQTKALLEDVKGQISEAYSRLDWNHKWGRHYLLSLARAHELQQCSNFKDPGVQVYATKKFALIRDRAEEIFCKLPPPIPSLARDDENGKKVLDGKKMKPVHSMGAYHNAGAPCFAAGEVKLADGRYVSVKDIVAGDLVSTTAKGRPAQVRCVVATACDGDIANLVELEGGVLVTPWHPIRLQGCCTGADWKFPCDLGIVSSYACDTVYSFVLEEGSVGVIQIGAYEAVTLGHGLENDGDGIAKHDYLGTKEVIGDLSGMIGWSDGRVELGPNPAVRDPQTGLIVAFQQRS